ncbi:MAG: M24 family metallopeptidase [Geminicoccaceae bacterium]
MADPAVFPSEEFDARLERVRAAMAADDLAGLVVTTPENIFYLTGLDHQGFFALHLLIVTAAGRMTLIARAMEGVTVADQVTGADFVGYADHEDPARVACAVVHDHGLASARIGVEKRSLFFPPRVYEALLGGTPDATWLDASRLIDELRLIKSPREIGYTRQAAAVTDAMMEAAIDAARPGVNEREVAAEAHRAMILAGGGTPGFGPFIRPTPRLGQEHTTWQDRPLVEGEGLLLEMAGCVNRYHAPAGRFVFIGRRPPGTLEIEQVCIEAFDRVTGAIRPGVSAAEVYRAWQSRVDEAGLAHYRRHHCGYLVGLGFPPSWTGGSMVVGLRHDSDLVLRPGMVFHLLSWLMGTGRGDYFFSNTALLTEEGCEILTKTSRRSQVV